MPYSPTLPQLLLAGGVALLVAGNCAKPTADPNAVYLTGHPWRVVAYDTINYTATPYKVRHVYARLPAYRRDDTYQFGDGYYLAFDEGALKAQPTDPQTTTGSWQLSGGDSQLDITLASAALLGSPRASAPNAFRLSTLSADTLRLASGSPAQTAVITLAR